VHIEGVESELAVRSGTRVSQSEYDWGSPAHLLEHLGTEALVMVFTFTLIERVESAKEQITVRRIV
jgi:hypothetical protein